MYYLAGLKSTALSFHYSEGNNFIKLERRLKLVKECVPVVWLKTSRLGMSLCKCSGGPLRPCLRTPQLLLHPGEREREREEGGKKKKNSWKVLLLLVALDGRRGRTCEWDSRRPPGGKLIYPFRSCCQCCQRMSCPSVLRGGGRAGWMKSFSDQWKEHFSVLTPIPPDGIVVKKQIYGKSDGN